jgi:dTDP-4-amino-4,6-dideoxygalactose transaminase
MQSVPLLNLDPEIESYWDELNSAVQGVMRSGQFILGPEVEQFETDVANYLGVEHAIGVNSGTDALVIGLRALGIQEGDEVITTPFTFFATAEAISIIGATPVFVDLMPGGFNLNPAAVEAAVTDKTRAILPVHLFGEPAAMAQLLQLAETHDLKVLEDCAQSFGATYENDCIGCHGEHCSAQVQAGLRGRKLGALGDVGAYSFFPTKNLGAYGDGGLITTDDADVAETARALRKHGGKNKYSNEMLGYNSRLDAMQAAILNVKLKYIDTYNRNRRAIAKRYNTLLDDVPGVETPPLVDGHVFHQYTVRIKDGKRDAVMEGLKANEIGCKVYYPTPCHQLPVYDDLTFSLPRAEAAAQEVLSLPIWPQAEAEVQERVARTIQEVVG